MTQQKSQIQQAIQASIDVLSAAQQGPDAEWLVLDNEQAKSATSLIQQAIGTLENLPKDKPDFKAFALRAISTLIYTESTISVLNNDTSEAHKGRTSSALEQLNQLLTIIDDAFQVN